MAAAGGDKRERPKAGPSSHTLHSAAYPPRLLSLRGNGIGQNGPFSPGFACPWQQRHPRPRRRSLQRSPLVSRLPCESPRCVPREREPIAGSLTPCSTHGFPLAGEVNSWVRVSRRVAGTPGSREYSLFAFSLERREVSDRIANRGEPGFSLPAGKPDILPRSTDQRGIGSRRPFSSALRGSRVKGETRLRGASRSLGPTLSPDLPPNSPPVTLQTTPSLRGFLLTRTSRSLTLFQRVSPFKWGVNGGPLEPPTPTHSE